MIFHTQTSLIVCSRGGERALEDMEMVSFSFLLRFGHPPPFCHSSFISHFNLKGASFSNNIIWKIIRLVGVLEGEKPFYARTHTHAHTNRHTPVLDS